MAARKQLQANKLKLGVCLPCMSVLIVPANTLIRERPEEAPYRSGSATRASGAQQAETAAPSDRLQASQNRAGISRTHCVLPAFVLVTDRDRLTTVDAYEEFHCRSGRNDEGRLGVCTGQREQRGAGSQMRGAEGRGRTRPGGLDYR